MKLNTKFTIVVISIAMTTSISAAQSIKRSIMDVIADGRVVGHQYQNDYFGVTVTAKDAKFTAPSSVKATAQRARLVDAVVNADDWQHKCTVSLWPTRWL